MLSTGEQAGFEATIIRPDGSKFNEYEVKHYVDEKGRAVTECWLESEDDAIFEIKIERTPREMTRFISSSWRAKCLVDGRLLGGSVWDHPLNPRITRYIHRKSEQNEHLRGNLTFAPADTNLQQELATIEPGAMQAIGSIVINLQPVKYTYKGTGERETTASIGSLLESAAKLARVTKSTNERTVGSTVREYTSQSEHPDVWQIFIFKYRHRASLETMGLIECPSPPPTANAAGPKRAKEVQMNVGKELDVPKVGGSGHRADVVEGYQNHQDPIRPFAGPSSTSEVGNDIQDRKLDMSPSAGFIAETEAINGTQPQVPNAWGAAEEGTDIVPLQTAQDSVVVGQALARLSVGPQPGDTSLGQPLHEVSDRKPDVPETTGPSSSIIPEQLDPCEDSDSDDDSWKAQAAMVENIQKHYAEIEKHQMAIKKLKRELKGKGRADKRSRTDEEGGGSGRAGNGKRNKVQSGQSIDLTEDSD